jgi:hypothetical protein
MALKMNRQDKKYQTVIDKNTFYFYNPIFQEKYESYINSLKETLLVLKNQVDIHGLRKDFFETLLAEKQYGLRALLALTGFANESLKRLITVARVTDNVELSKLLYKNHWVETESGNELKEWKDEKIAELIQDNRHFRAGIVNLFFEGSTIPFLVQTLPLFELKKLSISKLKFEIPALIDTLVRYKEKGSYSGNSENNPEHLIKTLLDDLHIPSDKGDLDKFSKEESVAKRKMDFILPTKTDPQIIIESSFSVTTSSGQGDKAKTEVNIKKLIEKHYPSAKFIGFIDGIGWYVRPGDLKRMVSAFDEVFTFHPDEIERFKLYLKQELKP